MVVRFFRSMKIVGREAGREVPSEARGAQTMSAK